MANLRKSDRTEQRVPDRSERVFNKVGLWYFRTREGTNVGPFRYESEARQMLAQFIRDMMTTEAQTALRTPKPHFRLSAIAEITERNLASVRAVV
ncbi:MAG: DUF6316 family protein [Pseudomonadota bacterium]